MIQFTNQLIASILQVFFVGTIPFLWWIISRKSNKVSLTNFLGIKQIITFNNSRFIFACLTAIVGLNVTAYFSLRTVSDFLILANGKFTNLSLWSILSIILYAFVQTSLSEEIFFRGFLAKRLIHKFSYKIGNIMQAALFGTVHILLFWSQNANISTLIFVGIMTGGIGYLLCYINEKLAGGSIFPSWIIHGVTNVVSTLVIILR